MPKNFKVADLGNASTKAHKTMVAPGAPQTCYDLAIYSLVKTGELKQAVYEAWICEIPKANTLLAVNPAVDTRLTDPNQLPTNSIIGFYRRFSKGGTSQLQAERDAGWVIYHMVRTMATPGARIRRAASRPAHHADAAKRVCPFGPTGMDVACRTPVLTKE